MVIEWEDMETKIDKTAGFLRKEESALIIIAPKRPPAQVL
jgi:hypothetical protein